MSNIQEPEQINNMSEKELLSNLGYSQKAIYYYIQKPYLGEMDDADQVFEMKGTCGDTMRIYLKIIKNTIIDARYQVIGCPGTIVSAMAVVDLIKRRHINFARVLDDHDVFSLLEEIPANKHHCIQLSVKTLHKAIDEWRKGTRHNQSSLFRWLDSQAIL